MDSLPIARVPGCPCCAADAPRILTPRDRVRLCEQRFTRATEALRELILLGYAEESILDELSELVRAANTLAVEQGRFGWLRASSLYRVNPVTALTDFQIARDREAQP